MPKKIYYICITGKLTRTKPEYGAMIQAAGHVWHEDIRADTNVLVMADPNTGSDKARKAADRGIKCIDEESLNALIADTAGKGFINGAGKYVTGFTRATVSAWGKAPATSVEVEEPDVKPVAKKASAARLLPD